MPDVILPFANPLIGGQLAQSHRAASMQALRGNGDFGAQAELAAIGKTRGSIHIYRRRIDLVDPASGILPGLRSGWNRNGPCYAHSYARWLHRFPRRLSIPKRETSTRYRNPPGRRAAWIRRKHRAWRIHAPGRSLLPERVNPQYAEEWQRQWRDAQGRCPGHCIQTAAEFLR